MIRSGNIKTSQDFFIVGVAIGFFGELLDNIYWTIPWSMDFINHPDTMCWHKHGVIPNIPFRQIATTVAAYCHIKSYVLHSTKNNDYIISAYGWVSLFLALAYSELILMLR